MAYVLTELLLDYNFNDKDCFEVSKSINVTPDFLGLTQDEYDILLVSLLDTALDLILTRNYIKNKYLPISKFGKGFSSGLKGIVKQAAENNFLLISKQVSDATVNINNLSETVNRIAVIDSDIEKRLSYYTHPSISFLG